MGLLHLYCGDGKGKTTAAAGLALRMAGCGKKVVMVRFLKHEDSGEVASLGLLPGVKLIPSAECFGFTWQMTEEEKRKAGIVCRNQLSLAWEEARKACREAEKAWEQEEVDACRESKKAWEQEEETCCGKAAACRETEAEVLLLLDEVCAALNHGFLELSSLLDYLDSRPANLEVVLTGRKPPGELWDRADYITEMKQIRHPYAYRIMARKGIEY